MYSIQTHAAYDYIRTQKGCRNLAAIVGDYVKHNDWSLEVRLLLNFILGVPMSLPIVAGRVLTSAGRPALTKISANIGKLGPRIRGLNLVKGITIGYLADKAIDEVVNYVSGPEEAKEARANVIAAMDHAEGEERAALAEIANSLIALYPPEDYDKLSPEQALYAVESTHNVTPAPPLAITEVDRNAIIELDRMQHAWRVVRRNMRFSVEEILAFKAVLGMSIPQMDMFEERLANRSI